MDSPHDDLNVNTGFRSSDAPITRPVAPDRRLEAGQIHPGVFARIHRLFRFDGHKGVEGKAHDAPAQSGYDGSPRFYASGDGWAGETGAQGLPGSRGADAPIVRVFLSSSLQESHDHEFLSLASALREWAVESVVDGRSPLLSPYFLPFHTVVTEASVAGGDSHIRSERMDGSVEEEQLEQLQPSSLLETYARFRRRFLEHAPEELVARMKQWRGLEPEEDGEDSSEKFSEVYQGIVSESEMRVKELQLEAARRRLASFIEEENEDEEEEEEEEGEYLEVLLNDDNIDAPSKETEEADYNPPSDLPTLFLDLHDADNLPNLPYYLPDSNGSNCRASRQTWNHRFICPWLRAHHDRLICFTLRNLTTGYTINSSEDSHYSRYPSAFSLFTRLSNGKQDNVVGPSFSLPPGFAIDLLLRKQCRYFSFSDCLSSLFRFQVCSNNVMADGEELVAFLDTFVHFEASSSCNARLLASMVGKRRRNQEMDLAVLAEEYALNSKQHPVISFPKFSIDESSNEEETLIFPDFTFGHFGSVFMLELEVCQGEKKTSKSSGFVHFRLTLRQLECEGFEILDVPGQVWEHSNREEEEENEAEPLVEEEEVDLLEEIERLTEKIAQMRKLALIEVHSTAVSVLHWLLGSMADLDGLDSLLRQIRDSVGSIEVTRAIFRKGPKKMQHQMALDALSEQQLLAWNFVYLLRYSVLLYIVDFFQGRSRPIPNDGYESIDLVVVTQRFDQRRREWETARVHDMFCLPTNSVVVISLHGGEGGPGGTGGQGGQGGNALTAAGYAGPGGAGGKGGIGGDGGNGGNVTLIASDSRLFSYVLFDVSGGAGGQSGDRGSRGSRGSIGQDPNDAPPSLFSRFSNELQTSSQIPATSSRDGIHGTVSYILYKGDHQLIPPHSGVFCAEFEQDLKTYVPEESIYAIRLNPPSLMGWIRNAKDAVSFVTTNLDSPSFALLKRLQRCFINGLIFDDPGYAVLSVRLMSLMNMSTPSSWFIVEFQRSGCDAFSSISPVKAAWMKAAAQNTHKRKAQSTRCQVASLPGSKEQAVGFAVPARRLKMNQLQKLAVTLQSGNGVGVICGVEGIRNADLSIELVFPTVEESIEESLLKLEGFLISEPSQVRTIGKRIGKGAYGYVYRGVYQPGMYPIPVAVKKIILENVPGANLSQVVHETLIQKEVMQHKNVLHCHGCYLREDKMHIVLEWCETDLHVWRSQRSPSVRKKLKVLHQLALGMCHIHSLGYVHRDLKPKNILIDEHGTVKIADFGMTCHESEFVESVVAGTPIYMPPPLSPTDDKKKFDVYSFAVLGWEVWTGTPAFSRFRHHYANKTPHEILQHIHQRTPPRRPDVNKCVEMSREMKQFLQQCWAVRPDARPSSEDIVEFLSEEISRSRQ